MLIGAHAVLNDEDIWKLKPSALYISGLVTVVVIAFACRGSFICILAMKLAGIRFVTTTMEHLMLQYNGRNAKRIK